MLLFGICPRIPRVLFRVCCLNSFTFGDERSRFQATHAGHDSPAIEGVRERVVSYWICTTLVGVAVALAMSCSSGSTQSQGDSGASSCDPIEVGAPRIRIAVLGDTGTGTANQDSVAALIASADADSDFDALILLGDMIYEEGNGALVDDRVLTPYADTLDDATQLIPVIGNHDVRMNMEEQIMADLGASGRWYSRVLDNILIIVLDTTRPNDAAQLAWLEAELMAAEQRWIVAAMHHPPYSAGYHGSNHTVRDAFRSLFEQYGVDLVLAGHDHDYQRQEVINDITYIVSGAGAKLRAAGSRSFTEVSESVLHFVEFEFTDDVVQATAHGVDGTVDAFSICHANSNQP